ncbi:MAG: hypothetical protein QM731_24965 [Chitinophagaceae bacterium]
MKLTRCTTLLVALVGCYASNAQIYTADNGLTTSGTGTSTKVSLGGTLTGNTTFQMGSNNFYFMGNGSLGIRTSSPQAPVHAYKNISGNFDPVMILEDALADGYVMFQMKGTGRQYHLGLGNASETYFGLANKFFIWDQNAQQPRMVVDPNGYIGMGTTAPATRLSIAGFTAGTSGLQFTQMNSASSVSTSNGKVLSLDASGNVILVNDVGSTTSVWALNGNSGTTAGPDFIGTNDHVDLIFKTGSAERIRLFAGGNMGVGITSDNTHRLQVNGNIWSNGSLILPTGAGAGKVLTSDASGVASWQTTVAGWGLGGNTVGVAKTFGTTDNYDLPFITNNTERMRIGANGNIGIGTVNISDATYKLFVESGIRTRRVKVDQVSPWPDYVFKPGYNLLSLTQLEEYIQKHNHLPEVPSAAEVANEGIELGDNQAVLLKKIEELTLYVIEQNKKMEEQQKRIESLEKTISTTKKNP